MYIYSFVIIFGIPSSLCCDGWNLLSPVPLSFVWLLRSLSVQLRGYRNDETRWLCEVLLFHFLSYLNLSAANSAWGWILFLYLSSPLPGILLLHEDAQHWTTYQTPLAICLLWFSLFTVTTALTMLYCVCCWSRWKLINKPYHLLVRCPDHHYLFSYL